MTTIETATSTDLPEVLALLRREDLPSAGVDVSHGEYLVARVDGATVGCIGLERYGDVGLLRSLAVAETERGRGTGRRLVEELLDAARRNGVHAVYLLTTTAEDYFPKFGFQVVDRSTVDARLHESEEFRGACPDTAVCMRRELT